MPYSNDIIQWLAIHKSTTLPNWLKRNPKINEWVLQQTAEYDVKNIMERVYIILNGPPQYCEYGNKKQFATFDQGYRSGCVLGNKCKCVASLRMENQKKTLLKKYGVDATSRIPGIVDRRRQTNLQRYGADHPMKTDLIKTKLKESVAARSEQENQVIKNRARQSFQERFGVDHHMKLVDQQQKVKNTNTEKYGVEFPLQNATILENMKETWKNKTPEQLQKIFDKTRRSMLEKHGVISGGRVHIPLETIEILDDKEKFVSEIEELTRKEAVKKFQISETTLHRYAKKHHALDKFVKPLSSEFELEIGNFLSNLNIQFEQNSRYIIKPNELDFYIPGKKVAIESCGLYWHGENSSGRTRNYHYNKHQKCLEQDITLVTIFEDEWRQQSYKVQKRLKHILNMNDSKIYARNCKIVIPLKSQVIKFLDENHLQGSINSKIDLALIYEDQMVALMTFGLPRYNKQYQYELLRFCTLGSVVGAASKLFFHFLKIYNPSTVISYSDNRWGSGKLYEKLNFENKKTTIGYYYTDYKNRYDRIKFQKHKLVREGFDPNLTEWEIMQQRGYDRIWDCGQTAWVYINNKQNKE